MVRVRGWPEWSSKEKGKNYFAQAITGLARGGGNQIK